MIDYLASASGVTLLLIAGISLTIWIFIVGIIETWKSLFRK